VTHLLQQIFMGFWHRLMHRRALHYRQPISNIKQDFETLLHDCETTRDRVVCKIQSARTPADLWDLRCEVHQCISQAHSQAEASRRINSLVNVFAGWVPAHKLTQI